MTMGTVIVLGYRKGIDDALRRRGLDTFHVVEKYKEALHGRAFRRVADLEDAQEVLRAVIGADVPDVVGVATGHEQGVFTSALLRTHLALPGDRDYGRALRFRDKFLQKAALPGEVARADCVYVTPEASYTALVSDLGTPFVVKPANGFGAARTTAVHSAQQFARIMDDARNRSDVACVAESFVHGQEIHIDGVRWGGQVLWSSVAQYHEPPMKWNEGSILASQILSPEQNPELVPKAQRLSEEVLAALDAPNCVFHLEAFRDGEKLVFSECATRISGAHLPEIVELTHGVNLYDAVVSLALGEDPSATLTPKDPERFFAYIYLRRFEGAELAQADFEKRFPFHEINYPHDGTARTGAYGRVGHAIVSAPTNAELRELITEIVMFNERGRD
ncbi:acetyl-CoA carboxylase biotin carboxylase subunit family protein [Streptomyces sp. NPDC018833]|uniref:acetyl-CoA carboxylase biotin carboxylase subunit family protein n=1 Tax=Streptomyces sp. NPDC018833 TaxID=3365053 RepID=UPI0037920591